MVDALQLAGEVAHRERGERGGGHAGDRGQPLALGLGAGGAQHADALGLRLALDGAGRGLGLGLGLRVAALTVDQLALAGGELDPVGQLVLRDGALLLHRRRAAREARLVGLLLQRLEGRGLQRACQFLGRTQVGHRNARDGDARFDQRGIAAQALEQGGAQRRGPALQRLADAQAAQVGARDLPGQREDHLLHALDGALGPAARGEVDGEVDPLGQPLGVVGAPAQGAVDYDLLEVGSLALHDHRQRPVVEGHLRDGCAIGPEPEALAPPGHAAAPVAEQLDVIGGLRAQAADQGISGDLGHDGPPWWVFSSVSPPRPRAGALPREVAPVDRGPGSRCAARRAPRVRVRGSGKIAAISDPLEQLGGAVRAARLALAGGAQPAAVQQAAAEGGLGEGPRLHRLPDGLGVP